MKTVTLKFIAVLRLKNQVVFEVVGAPKGSSVITMTVPEASMNGALNHLYGNMRALNLILEFNLLLDALLKTGECSETLRSTHEKATRFIEMPASHIIHQSPVVVTTERSSDGNSADIHLPMDGRCHVDSADLDVVASIVRLLTHGAEIRQLLQEMTPWIGGYLNEMPVDKKECHRVARLLQHAHRLGAFAPVSYGSAGAMMYIRDSDKLDVINKTLQVNGVPVVVEFPQCDLVSIKDGIITIQSNGQYGKEPVGSEFLLYTYA